MFINIDDQTIAFSTLIGRPKIGLQKTYAIEDFLRKAVTAIGEFFWISEPSGDAAHDTPPATNIVGCAHMATGITPNM